MSIPSQSEEPASISHNFRALIVDDSRTIRALVRRTLELRSYDVVEAADGSEALAILDQDRRWDILVVDLSMPRIDGIALIDRLRRDPTLPHYPILVLSGEDINPEVDIIPGADAFIPKPFKPSELLDTIDRLVSASRE